MPDEEHTQHPHTQNILHRDSSSSQCSTYSTPTTALLSMTQTPSSSQETTATVGLVTSVDEEASTLLWNTLQHNYPSLCINKPTEMIADIQRTILPCNTEGLCTQKWEKKKKKWPHTQQERSTLSKTLNRFHFLRIQWKTQSVSLASFHLLQVHSGEQTSQLEHRLLWKLCRTERFITKHALPLISSGNCARKAGNEEFFEPLMPCEQSRSIRF